MIQGFFTHLPALLIRFHRIRNRMVSVRVLSPTSLPRHSTATKGTVCTAKAFSSLETGVPPGATSQGSHLRGHISGAAFIKSAARHALPVHHCMRCM